MVDLAQVLDEIHAREERDDIWAEGHGDGYTQATAEIEALLNAKGPAAAKLKAIRAWADAQSN